MRCPTVFPLILILFFTASWTNCIHFCFQKDIQITTQHYLTTEKSDNDLKPPEETTTQSIQTELRSYHPHYLMSLSYPHPITSHIYYGQVSRDKPIFLYSDFDKWHPNSIQKFTINGVEYTDASAKYFLLRRQQIFRYMLVLQIENSYEKDIPYTMEVNQMSNHYFIVCKFQDKNEAFAIYLTENGKVLELNSHPGIKLFVRNETGSSARMNWRFSREVHWKGRDQRGQGTNFGGFVLEIQYSDRKLLDSVKLNLREIKNSSVSTSTFLKKEPSIFDKNHPQIILVKQKYQSCPATASQKVFDGLSYEYGRLQIKDGARGIQNDPQELLSFCPSGKRFPWGFLWDDGFHCEVAVRKDHKLVLKVIKSWLDTMLDNGWIPREQNRGAEREDLCSCPRFMTKDIRDGNPPTLLLALDYLNKRKMLAGDNFSEDYWQKVKKWYKWFMSTQKDSDSLIFKWHDSLNQQGASFTSGMDDFPRPVTSKGQIDLQTWMYFFTKFLAETAHIYGESNEEYISNLEIIKDNFKYFVSPQDSTYRDIASDGTFSQYFGYPNILPIAFGVPPYQSKEYNATIDKVKRQLDIGNGLASISKLSHFYLENRDAYWKGPVWININYLFLRGLKLFYSQEKELYDKLRSDLLRVVCDNWKKSGYFYQNYIEGKGSFGYPFNGWTSLIAVIDEESY